MVPSTSLASAFRIGVTGRQERRVISDQVHPLASLGCLVDAVDQAAQPSG
jgi:hypothetical protein